VVGYAIIANLSLRRSDSRPAALAVALGYAAVQLGFGVIPILADQQKLSVDALLIVLALGFKIILSIAVYALVIRFFVTFNELRQLQESGFRKRQDYMSSDGVAAVIGNRLVRTPRKIKNKEKSIAPDLEGFVNVVVRLPGEKNRRVACIWWPNGAQEKKARVLDWTPAGSFAPLGELVDPNNPQGPRQYLEWEWATVFLNQVLSDENHSEFIWPDDQVRVSEDIKYNGRMTTVANVVIRADGAAIGCLQVGRCNSTFSQMAIRQIVGVAKLLTPSVQAYRELAGLDNMSIRFAERQADEKFYSSDKATEEIATIIHDLFGVELTRFCIDFGFSGPDLVYRIKPGNEHLRVAFDEQLVDPESKDVEQTDAEQPDSNGHNPLPGTLPYQRRQNELQLLREVKWTAYPRELKCKLGNLETEYRILKKTLSARVTETLSYQSADDPGKFDMGHLVLVVDGKKDDYNQPALGTTYLHRKGASTLAADAYLDFQRDYHNNILKTLGQELSAQRLNVNEWFEPIQRLLTNEGALCWVVAEQERARELLGDEHGKSIVSKLNELQAEERFFSSTQVHYRLKKPKHDTHHVLKLKLPNVDTIIWLGVHRKGFNSELDFPSPWKTFLDNFVQIADASLSRITFPETFGLQLEAAQLQGIIASLATSGTVIHQFGNMIESQIGSFKDLAEAIDHDGVPGKDELKNTLTLLRNSARNMREVFESISRLTSSEDQRPCRLFQAAQRAFRFYETSLIKREIKGEIAIPEDLLADVPFNVATMALATLVGNSKDAIQKDEGGLIRIEASRNGSEIICHVIDNGVGINSDQRSKLFEPKDSTKPHGTGMGLFLTAHSLSENASSITLTKSDETGSTFTLRFPLGKKGAD
jgi:signal transduction histidine kinase